MTRRGREKTRKEREQQREIERGRVGRQGGVDERGREARREEDKDRGETRR